MMKEGHVVRLAEMKNAYKIPVGNPEGKLVIRPRGRWLE
jgi:hypothetical protein